MSEQERCYKSYLVQAPHVVDTETEAQERGNQFSAGGRQTRAQFFSRFLLCFTMHAFSLHILIFDPSL